MRIAVCGRILTFGHIGGGIPRVCEELCVNLAKVGHEVHFFGFSYRSISKQHMYKGARMHYVPITELPFLFPYLSYSLRVNDFIKKVNPDVVHTNFAYGPFFGKLDFPHLHTVHETAVRELIVKLKRKPSIEAFLSYPITLSIEYNNVIHADKVVTHSEGTAQDVNRYYRRSNVVIPLGVDIQKFKPMKVEHDGPNLLFVSRRDPRKNLRSLIEAIKDTNWKLRIIGINKFAGKNIVSLGHVSDDRLVFEYNRADVFVLPSVREGFGLVVLEALACNKPVIMCDTGCSSIIRKYDVGVISKNATAGALRASIQQALGKDWENRPREAAKRFTWKECTKKYEELYKCIISES